MVEVPILDSNRRVKPKQLGANAGDASTILYGDGVFRSAPSGGGGGADPTNSKIVRGVYALGWDNMTVQTVHANYNHIYLFNAEPASGGNGSIVWPYAKPTNMQTRRSQGTKIILSCGGAGATFNFDTRTQSTNFVNSVIALHTSWGGTQAAPVIDGIDLNTYEASASRNVTEYTWICAQFRAYFGAGFIITSPPAPWNQVDKDFCKALLDNGSFDYVSPQLYDGGGNPVVPSVSNIVSKVTDWVTNVASGDASKIAVGWGYNPAQPNDYSTLAQIQESWSQLKAAFPSLRGGYVWSGTNDKNNGWPVATWMGSAIPTTTTTTGGGGAIADGSVTTAKLADGSVTNAKISGVISAAKLGTGVGTTPGSKVLYDDGTFKTAPTGGGGGAIITGANPFSFTRITTPATISVCGIDPGTLGRIFGSNRTFGPAAQSDDYGVTWYNRGNPTGTTANTLQKIVAFKGNVYASFADTATPATAVRGIYRAPLTAATGGVMAWESSPVEVSTAGIEGKSTTLTAGSQYLFWGEYEAAGTVIAGLGGPRIRRSIDGTTWETVMDRDATVKHIHAIAEDPYNPGHIYVTLGDNGTPNSVLRSTQHGAAGTFQPIISAVGNLWQSVQISFTPHHVWLSSDRIGFGVARFDRSALQPEIVHTNNVYNQPVPGGASGDLFYQLGYFGAVDPETGVYYHMQMDTSTPGNTFGVFYLPRPGSRLELLDFWKSGTAGYSSGEVFIANGRVYIGNLVMQTIKALPAGGGGGGGNMYQVLDTATSRPTTNASDAVWVTSATPGTPPTTPSWFNAATYPLDRLVTT